MPTEQQQLESVISGLEAQRALLGDALVDASLAPLRARLAMLIAPAAVPVAPAAQILKQVTILFLDVVGSTTLSQHLDPENTYAVLDGALSCFTAIVDAHQGKVLQYAGDSVLAVFGADVSREDDPERAVRAGLVLLAEGRRQGEMVAQRHGYTGFNVRLGIHTGGVLLGGGVDGESSIHGIVVNVAARMEQSAPAGALRISHDTYRHVRGLFDVEAQPPLEVKGVDTPIVTYLVQRAKPRAFRVATRGIEGVETRMVGRDAELELLQDAFKRLYRGDARFAAITVVAEAGIGKSRLLYEFENWAETRPETFYIFEGRAKPQTQSQPYGLLRDILAWRLQIADSDSMDAAKRKIEQGIAPLFQKDDGDDMAQAHAHLLGHLIGLDFSESRHVKGILEDAKQIRNRGFHAAAQMFRRVAAQDGTPIVLLLDDLHGADDGSLDFLNYLGQVNRDVPMLMLGLTRPTLFERRPNWAGTAEAQRVDLGPLDRGASRLLANELLQKIDEIPAALRELIIGGAEGNPFYMEELVKMLVDEGAIETGPERWTVIPAKLLATRVPQTLTGVLQARLDGLKPAEKLALQQASVIGFVFWDQALAAIDASATEALPGLIRRELVIAHQDTGLDGVREYAFKHQILHHVTYDTVLKRMRRDWHAKVGAWLAGLTGLRASDFLGAAAEHFEKAGDNERACEYYARAAEHAAGRYAHEAALSYVANSLALMGKDERPDKLLLRWRLFDARERTLDLLGRRTEQRGDLDALQQLADALDDDIRRAKVALRHSRIARTMADYRTTETTARQAMALAERAGCMELGLDAQQVLASALVFLGDAAAGKRLAQAGLTAARVLGLRRAESLHFNVLSEIMNRQHDVVAALEMSRQDLLISRELGNRHDETASLCNLGNCWLELGECTQARCNLNEGLRLARAVGHYTVEPYALIGLSRLALWQGDDALARAHAQAALDVALAVGDRREEGEGLCHLGDAELALGRHEAATAAFERARAVAMAIGVGNHYDAEAGLARAALAQGDVAGAMQAVKGSLAHLAGGGTLVGTNCPRFIRLTCHQVLARAGDPRAAEVLAGAHAELQARAAAITDTALRHGFLNNIPEHREIVAAYRSFAPSTMKPS